VLEHVAGVDEDITVRNDEAVVLEVRVGDGHDAHESQ
jgi:hypothetical protein